MESFLHAETLIIELLLAASIVAIVVQRLRIPYTVALVLVGLAFTAFPDTHLELTPELILGIFVPPLVFEAAFHISLTDLRHNWRALTVLAVPGVILTMIIVGGIVSFGVGLPLSVALLFGALMSATDPVAVVALFRSLGAPKRLTLLVEGESLLNDGTAIVVFNLMLIAALTGIFDLPQSVVQFVVVSVGGIAIGAALGWLMSRAFSLLDNYLIETTLTTVVAYGSYLLAERMHVSGVLAVVAAGILSGSLGPRQMSPTTKIVLYNFWEYMAFVANSMIFLLIGLQINLAALTADAWPIAVAIVAVVASRLIVFPLSWLLNRWGEKIPPAYTKVLFWGGLRGAVSLALALSLPATLTYSNLLRVMAFGVVLFTLLVQGTTMDFVLRRLGLVERSDEIQGRQRLRAQMLMLRAAHDRLRSLYSEGMIASEIYVTLQTDIETAERGLQEDVHELLQARPDMAVAAMNRAQREGLRAQRSLVADLQRDGVISDKVYADLVAEVDAQLDSESPRMIGLPQPSDDTDDTPNEHGDGPGPRARARG
ncbi:MAG: Na+/H+ antiporter [Anaerolineae bacterium]